VRVRDEHREKDSKRQLFFKHSVPPQNKLSSLLTTSRLKDLVNTTMKLFQTKCRKDIFFSFVKN
jgi:hypothetical protein